MKNVLIWLLLLLVICFLALRVLFIPNYVTALSYKGEAISINRDKFGVPRIQAVSRNSAYFAMGYSIAEDRIFQMHMKRMVAQGRLSEMFGERSLVVDKIFRTLGLGHWASLADQRVMSVSDLVQSGRSGELRSIPSLFRWCQQLRQKQHITN